MSPHLLLASIATVLVFDGLASVASRTFGFPYGRAAIGSSVLYFAIGVCAVRADPPSRIGIAAGTAAIVGLADASLGWALSWYIGPGKLPPTKLLTVGVWIRTALVVVALAAVLGAMGGWAGGARVATGIAAT